MDQKTNTDDLELLLLLALSTLAVRTMTKKRKKRRWWVRPIYEQKARKLQGHGYNLLQELKLKDSDIPSITKRSYREPIPPEHRLALTLRFLATGDSLQTCAFAYRVAKCTASKIINETCCEIWNSLVNMYLKPPVGEKWQEIETGFCNIWQLPNCIGALDGKHKKIEAPPNMLMALCDAHYKFTYVDNGAYGSQSDGGILKNSVLGKKLINNNLNTPKDKIMPNTNIPVPLYFVGDEAFPLRTDLMRPYNRKNLNREKSIFNYRSPFGNSWSTKFG
ncbi:hypothetical protein NQ317_017432 [Molorchus minor]|uniref:DDE Tnp4 domain-containing protein n=1 Tax=Molorchus minor TaxID=1323400 RepID=A0ABQ9JBH0_9CUCU|nr:hypothetical protein NQ317_017432 [Molorchus minor]